MYKIFEIWGFVAPATIYMKSHANLEKLHCDGTDLFLPLLKYSHNVDIYPRNADGIKATIVFSCSSTPTR